MAERKTLNDVYVMRPIAIFLLVVWHSFIIYTGDWKEPVGFSPIESYWWLAKLSYTFMLELFVFVSGYVLYGMVVYRVVRYFMVQLVFGVGYMFGIRKKLKNINKQILLETKNISE